MSGFGSLVVLRRDGTAGRTIALTEESYLFGRSEECDLRINLESVAEKECVLHFRTGTAVLTNISGNPIAINKETFSTKNEEICLYNKDVFCFGGRSFRFIFDIVPSPASEINYTEIENNICKKQENINSLQRRIQTPSKLKESNTEMPSLSVNKAEFLQEDRQIVLRRSERIKELKRRKELAKKSK